MFYIVIISLTLEIFTHYYKVPYDTDAIRIPTICEPNKDQTIYFIRLRI